ncbi:MAG: CDP-alcohol phosphatidyltransferase family protein [Bacteroidetes bacterium]|nr:CDP-alcohol phosphatidyltransferase family protein [Bacteroidota bacterium]
MTNQERVQALPLLQHLGKFWTAANILSLSRVVLAVPATYLTLAGAHLFEGAAGTWLFVLILVMILTDWFDGKLARWSHTVSNWGKVLDPLADKFAAIALILALVIRGSLPVWFLGVILARDVVLVSGAVLLRRRTGHVVMSIWWGKVAMNALAVTVLVALLDPDPPVLQVFIWLTVAFMLYAFVLYVFRGLRLWRTVRPPSDTLDHRP